MIPYYYNISKSVERLPLFVIDGQSNATGIRDVSGLSSPLTGVIPNSFIHFNDDGFYPLEAGVNQCGYGELQPGTLPNENPNPNNHGFELNMMYQLGQYTQRNNYLLKLSKRATGLAQNPSEPDHNVNSVEQLHQKLIDYVGLIDLNTYEPKAFIWYQGEDDSIVEEYANAYGANEIDKFNAVRTILGNPNLPIISILVNENTSSWSFKSEVNAGKTATANTLENVTIIDPSITNQGNQVYQLESGGKGAHYTTDGYNALGNAIFELIKDL